ncbi:MAG: hypothetical protein IKU17_02210 [Clostridia bacterium]|nr:hypothetical protein [Clostridia bacterium]
MLPEEARDFIDELELTPENAANASLAQWLPALFSSLRTRAETPLHSLGLCLCAVVLCAVCSALRTGVLGELPEDLGGMAIFTLLALPLARVIDAAAAALHGAGTFLLGAVPVYGGVLAAMGKTVSAGSFGVWMMAAGNAVTWLAQAVILPLLYVLLAFAVASSLSVPELSRLSGSVYSAARWILVLAVTFFTGLLSVQGVLSGAADTAAGKTAKLVVKNAVPMVGGLISDAAGAVQASVTLLRSGVGVFVLLALLAVFVPLLAEHAAWIFVLFLSAVAADLFGLKRLAGLFSACKTVLQLLFACVISCAAVLIICAGVILTLGNSS